VVNNSLGFSKRIQLYGIVHRPTSMLKILRDTDLYTGSSRKDLMFSNLYNFRNRQVISPGPVVKFTKKLKKIRHRDDFCF
jgi:hypothetical protein